jgi:hypothetical protein
MGPVKSLASGFAAMTAVVWTCNVIILEKEQNAWLAVFGLLVLALSFSGFVSLWLTKRRKVATSAMGGARWRSTLFALQGAALACWIFDLTTTFYAINVARVASEVNPLGWPLGMLGALAYYGPTLTLTYVLLFRIRENISLYVAVPVTAVALIMGLMNLHAGTLNLEIFTGTASLAAEIGYGSLALLLVVGFLFPRLFVRQPGAGFKS